MSEVINKHEITPVVSDQRICIRACRQRTTTPSSVNSSSPIMNSFDQKLLVVNSALMTEAGKTPPPATTKRPDGAFSNAGSTKTGLLNSSSVVGGSKTQSPSSASLTYRNRSPQPNSTVSSNRGSASTPASLSVSSATLLPSPEEMLRVMLLQAGLDNFSVQIPAFDEPPRYVTTMTPLRLNSSSRAISASAASASLGSTKSPTEFSVIYPTTVISINSTSYAKNTLNNNSINSTIPGNPTANSNTSGTTITDETLSQAQLLALAGMALDKSTLLPPNLTPPPGAVQIGVVLHSPPGAKQDRDINVLPSDNGQIEPNIEPGSRIKSSENVVTGFNLGQTPTAGELLVRSKGQNPSIGPLPAASGSPPPAISMTPEQMLQALLQQSGMGGVKIEGFDSSPPVVNAPVRTVPGRVRNNGELY